MRILPLLFGAAVAAAFQAPAQSIDCHFECAGGVPFKLVWQSQADRSYDLFYSPDLSGWSHVDGYPQPGNGASMEQPFAAGTQGFYKVTSLGSFVPDGFALIPAGSFLMGDQSNQLVGGSGERPVHSVYVSWFYMAKYEVTKALWDEVRAWGLGNGYTDLPVGGGKGANHPVHSINWYAMAKWCNARSEKEGLVPCHTVSDATYKTGESAPVCNWNANGYRLPTEAEWEKAARGGLVGLNCPWGDTINHSNANYVAKGGANGYDTSPYTTLTYHPTYNDGVMPYTSPVGSFAPNGYGLYDVIGNLGECCWDWYLPFYYSSSPGTDLRGPASGSSRGWRGGRWNDSALEARCAFRCSYAPSFYGNGFGFRLARSSAP